MHQELILDHNAITQLPVELHRLPALASDGRFSCRSDNLSTTPVLPPKHLLGIAATTSHRGPSGHARGSTDVSSGNSGGGGAAAGGANTDGSAAAAAGAAGGSGGSCYGVNFAAQAKEAARVQHKGRKSSAHQRGYQHLLGGPGLREEGDGDDSGAAKKTDHDAVRNPHRVKVRCLLCQLLLLLLLFFFFLFGAGGKGGRKGWREREREGVCVHACACV